MSETSVYGLLGIARCSRGQLGLVLRSPRWITYPGGWRAIAWTGVHLPRVWRRWSSRHPVWIVRR